MIIFIVESKHDDRKCPGPAYAQARSALLEAADLIGVAGSKIQNRVQGIPQVPANFMSVNDLSLVAGVGIEPTLTLR